METMTESARTVRAYYEAGVWYMMMRKWRIFSRGLGKKCTGVYIGFVFCCVQTFTL